MRETCENCGCHVYNGLCVNCNEEAHIVDTQWEFLPEHMQSEFLAKVERDRKEQLQRKAKK